MTITIEELTSFKEAAIRADAAFREATCSPYYQQGMYQHRSLDPAREAKLSIDVELAHDAYRRALRLFTQPPPVETKATEDDTSQPVTHYTGMITHYTTEQGGQWIPFNDVRDETIFSLRLNDGSVWDRYYGWRVAKQFPTDSTERFWSDEPATVSP